MFRIYAQSVHNGLDVIQQLILALTINWSNCTALIRGLDVFCILLSAIFSVKYLVPQNY